MKKQSAAGRRRPPRTGSKVFLAVMTFLNLLLSLLISLLHRQEVLHAVTNDEDVQVLLTAKKETKAQ